jgi:hypothetical protein
MEPLQPKIVLLTHKCILSLYIGSPQVMVPFAFYASVILLSIIREKKIYKQTISSQLILKSEASNLLSQDGPHIGLISLLVQWV